MYRAERPYRPEEDAAIRARKVPDSVLAEQLGRSPSALWHRRRALGCSPPIDPAERRQLLRESIAAYEAQLVEAQRRVHELEREIAARKIRLQEGKD